MGNSVNSIPVDYLENRIEELSFLAEAIAEQSQFFEKHGREIATQISPLKTVASSADALEDFPNQVQKLLAQIEETRRQREELNDLRVDLAKREEKLRGQKNSLTQRFRAERSQLQLDKLELDSLRSLIGDNPGEASDESETDEIRQLSESLADFELENATLQDENRRLREQLAEYNSVNHGADDAVHLAEAIELKRELELTLQQLQQAESELLRQRSNSATPNAAVSWEEQKQRMLANLENESNDGSSTHDPSLVQNKIEEYERVIQQKDHTIAQLEILLKEQESENLAVISEEQKEQRQMIIDKDEIIAMERSRLSDLEKQWREKIGEAEIELSRERARLSRDRAALENQIEELEEKTKEVDSKLNSIDSKEPKKRKWMEQLGLA